MNEENAVKEAPLEPRTVDLKSVPEKSPPAVQPPSSNFKRWVFLGGLLIGCLAIFFFAPKPLRWPWDKGSEQTGPAGAEGAPTKGKGKKSSGTVQVVAADVRRGDLGTYVTGLGSVTPIYTVTLKSRVDGELTKILFSEGQIVKQGDLLIELDSRPYKVQLAQAQAQLSRDQALLNNARLDLERYRKLMAQDAIPQQQLTTQEALMAQYVAAIQGDEAAIDSARLNLEYCRIKSPITGLVGLRLVDPGNIVRATDAGGMLVITQMDPISVVFTMAEDQLQPVLKRFHAGRQLQVEAWDRDLKKRLGIGKLETIDNQIDPSTGTVRLRAVFDNKDGALFPSQFVNAKMLVEMNHGVTLVPTAAIQRNPTNTYVWLMNPDQTVAVREVSLLTSEGDDTGIASGLEPGERVVTIGVDRLRNGSKVNPEAPKDKSKKKSS